MFYPDVRGHISPSALATWHTSKSAFIQRYFAGEEFRATAIMQSGSRIHALIEGGLFTPEHRYEHSEKELKFEVVEGVVMLGYPDSHQETNKAEVNVVDYKTGYEDSWSENKMLDDLKIKATAWLVWKANPKAKKVHSHIDYIQVAWDDDGREHVPTGKTATYSITYTAQELEKFTQVIVKTIAAVNKEYETWTDLPTEAFIDPTDLEMYETLLRQKEAIDTNLAELNTRFEEAMKFMGKHNAKTPFGTFYFRTTTKYAYPEDLPVHTEGRILQRAEAEKEMKEIATAIKQSEKQFEAENEPFEVNQTLAFRAATKKKN